MNPTHVLKMIETSGPGGAERVLINIAGRLERDPGWRASAILKRDGWVAEQLRAQKISPRFLETRRMLDLGFVRQVARLARGEEVRLIHSHDFDMNVHGSLAAKLAGIPCIATVHGRGYYNEARRRILAMRSLRWLGTTVVAVSADIQELLEDLGLRGVRMIPNGIDLGAYENAPRLPRSTWGLPEHAPVVGAVGNLYSVKGHRVLVEAIARCGVPGVHVAIAGRGEEEEPLRQLAGELGIADRVHLLGFRSDVPELLRCVDVYAMPSFSEGQSLALMEAMASGVPIVATRVGGNPEIVRDDSEGLLVPAGDPDAMGLALRRLIENPAEADRLSDAAVGRARLRFSLDAMISAYQDLYRERGVTAAVPSG